MLRSLARQVGEAVGELEFIFGIRHQSNARSGSSPATLLVLRKDDYSQLIKLYPEDEEAVTRAALSSLGWGTGSSVGGGRGTSEAGTSAVGSHVSGVSNTDRHALDDMRSVAKIVDQARKKKRNERCVEIVSCAARGDLEGMRRLLATTEGARGCPLLNPALCSNPAHPPPPPKPRGLTPAALC